MGTTVRDRLVAAGARRVARSPTFAAVHGAYWRWRIALFEDDVEVSVDDIEAQFDVTTRSEYLRARRLGGERHVLSALLDDLEGDEVVWDVGACVGTYACLVARALESGHLVAFEPESTNREQLRENLRSNATPGRWTASPYALADRDGEQVLASEFVEAGAGHHHLAEGGADGSIVDAAVTTDDDGEAVEARRGDTLVDEGLPKPTVAKVDVQGAELAVLRGMAGILADLQLLYLEVHPEKCRRYGATALKVEAWLEDRGFDLTRLGEPTTHRSGVYFLKASR